MNWVDALDNPQAVVSLFGEAAGLSSVRLREACLHQDGPVLRLRFDAPAVPKNPPARWPQASNTTQVLLAAWQIHAVNIRGWAWDIRGELSVTERDGGRVLVFAGSDCDISAGFGLLRAERISGYVDAPPD